MKNERKELGVKKEKGILIGKSFIKKAYIENKRRLGKRGTNEKLKKRELAR